MVEAVFGLIFSGVAFGAECFLVYQIVRHRDRWDDFWGRQNRQRFLAPKGWAESAVSQWLSYVFAIVLLIGGFLGLLSSLVSLLPLARSRVISFTIHH
jgi:hypothetical protein